MDPRRRRVPLNVVYLGTLDADGDEHGFVGEGAAATIPVFAGVDVTAPADGSISVSHGRAHRHRTYRN